MKVSFSFVFSFMDANCSTDILESTNETKKKPHLFPIMAYTGLTAFHRARRTLHRRSNGPWT